MSWTIPGWVGQTVRLTVDTVAEFQRNQGSLMAAGLAYYMLLSASPLFVVAIAVGGSILGRDQAREILLSRIDAVLGSEAAETLTQLMQDERLFAGGLTASLIAAAVLFYGSTNAFTALQASLDVMWGTPPSDSVTTGLLQLVRSRLLAFVMVLAVGLMMLVTMMLETIGSTVGSLLVRYSPLDPQIGSWGQSLAVLALRAIALATVYRVLPARRIAWRAVWPAGLVSAILIGLGHKLIGWYVAYGGVRSAYGAAGSIIVLLFAFYYAAFVVLLGAQLAQVYATRFLTPESAAGRR